MKRIVLTVAAAALFALAGCASTNTTTGTAANKANLDQLEVGVTTIDQAIALLGQPGNITRTANGTVLGYVQMHVKQHGFMGTSADVDSDTLVLMFDTDGKLLNYGDSLQHTQIRRGAPVQNP